MQALSEAESLGTARGLAKPKGGSLNLWAFGGSHWDWDAPGQAEWEALSMAERTRWLPEAKRDVPEPGDRILFIDGQAWRHRHTCALCCSPRHTIQANNVHTVCGNHYLVTT